MKFLAMVFLLGALVAPVASAEEMIESPSLEQKVSEKTLPSCERLVQRRELCVRIREARAIVEGVTLGIFEGLVERAKGKKGKTILREFAVVAYDPLDDTFHTIKLGMPLVGNSTFQPIVLTEHDPPYLVTRIKGQTFNKMLFEVTLSGRELFVYAGKHLSVPAAFRSRDVRTMTREAESVTYLATPPYLVNEEFVAAGKEYVLAVLQEVLFELREKRVYSKTYSGRLVADVVTPEILLNLLVIEQTDPCLLQDREPGCVRLLPKLLYAQDEHVMDAVLVEFVLNGLDAYRYICSTAAACGAYQFTNNKTHRFGGTYNMVRSTYPEALLDPSFGRGTESFHNSAKAAALLIDLELSSRGVPDWVRQAFVEDERVGALFPAAAYNGGASQSRALAQLVTEYRRLRGIAVTTFETFPWQEFFVWVKAKGKAFKTETLGYMQKSILAWRHLVPRKVQLPSVEE